MGRRPNDLFNVSSYENSREGAVQVLRLERQGDWDREKKRRHSQHRRMVRREAYRREKVREEIGVSKQVASEILIQCIKRKKQICARGSGKVVFALV